MNDDDYLWNRSGTPDPEVARLESDLARHRWSGRLPSEALPQPRAALRRRVPFAVAAGLIAVALVAAGLWLWPALRPTAVAGPGADSVADAPRPTLPPAPRRVLYRAEALSGRIAQSEFAAGERLVTDAATRAQLTIGDVGSVLVEPDTRLRVEAPPNSAGGAEHLLYLERGALTASIFAAPRLFQVGTPSGIAVDMGCVYTARVADDGSTQLSVSTGQVSFETEGRQVTVPSGASCRASPGRGPGTPVWDDAPEDYRAAVDRLDDAVARGAEAAPDRERALADVLATERADDSLTLWHVLAWPAMPDDDRTRVCEALQRLAPAPDGLSASACRELDAGALAAWRETLDWSW